MNMRIGIDGSVFQRRTSGVGRYVSYLCRELDMVLPESSFYVYSNKPVELPVASSRWIARFETREMARRLKPILWLKTRAQALCAADGLDLFWAGNVFFPRLPSGVKKVATVHDLNYRVAPASMGATHRWAHELFFAKDVKSADAIVVNSQGTARRLRELLRVDATAVITPGVDASFSPRSEDEIRSILGKYGMKRPYFLTVGTWEPRKNLEMAIEAFIVLKREGLLQDHMLTMIGPEGWKGRGLAALGDRIESHDIMRIGCVPDAELPAFYSGAEALLFPSVYEGFGMPVLEARACGTAVIATDIPEIREAGGSGACYIQPTVDAIRNGLMRLREGAVFKADAAARLPSWSDGAATLAGIFAGLAGQPRRGREAR